MKSPSAIVYTGTLETPLSQLDLRTEKQSIIDKSDFHAFHKANYIINNQNMHFIKQVIFITWSQHVFHPVLMAQF